MRCRAFSCTRFQAVREQRKHAPRPPQPQQAQQAPAQPRPVANPPPPGQLPQAAQVMRPAPAGPPPQQAGAPARAAVAPQAAAARPQQPQAAAVRPLQPQAVAPRPLQPNPGATKSLRLHTPDCAIMCRAPRPLPSLTDRAILFGCQSQRWEVPRAPLRAFSRAPIPLWGRRWPRQRRALVAQLVSHPVRHSAERTWGTDSSCIQHTSRAVTAHSLVCRSPDAAQAPPAGQRPAGLAAAAAAGAAAREEKPPQNRVRTLPAGITRVDRSMIVLLRSPDAPTRVAPLPTSTAPTSATAADDTRPGPQSMARGRSAHLRPSPPPALLPRLR